MLAFNKRINKLHWPRPVQGNHGDDIFKHTGAQLAQVAFHTGRFKLENTGRIPPLEELIGFFIIKRQLGKVDFGFIYFANDPEGVIDNR